MKTYGYVKGHGDNIKEVVFHVYFEVIDVVEEKYN